MRWIGLVPSLPNLRTLSRLVPFLITPSIGRAVHYLSLTCFLIPGCPKRPPTCSRPSISAERKDPRQCFPVTGSGPGAAQGRHACICIWELFRLFVVVSGRCSSVLTLIVCLSEGERESSKSEVNFTHCLSASRTIHPTQNLRTGTHTHRKIRKTVCVFCP